MSSLQADSDIESSVLWALVTATIRCYGLHTSNINPFILAYLNVAFP